MHRTQHEGDDSPAWHELAQVAPVVHTTSIGSKSGLALHGTENGTRRASKTSQLNPKITSNMKTAIVICCVTYGAGKSRNAAFATMGGSQPVGFGLGLILGGVFASTIGWQWGFYTAAITNLVMFIVSAWQLPRNLQDTSQHLWHRLINDIDWIGAFLASVALAVLSYIITYAQSDFATRKVRQLIILQRHYWQSHGHAKTHEYLPINPVICAFPGFRTLGGPTGADRPASIDPKLTLASQSVLEVQKISPLGAAIRFIPAPISGALTNVVVGFIVHRVRGDWIVISTSIPTVVASVLMAIANPKWSYWACTFVANFFNPIGADGIFTVSNLLITSMFPPKTQGVAGGVFNTVSQTGKNVGLALSALIANQVTAHTQSVDKHSPDALLAGYRAAFWFCAGLTGASLCISIWGLRNIGKVGQKKD
ncbi:MAG: hypothetical protein Q9180_001161 [Flavoplaca navasiana]